MESSLCIPECRECVSRCVGVLVCRSACGQCVGVSLAVVQDDSQYGAAPIAA